MTTGNLNCSDLNCCDFVNAFEALGEAFAKLCNCLKPPCAWALTSGPLHKDLAMFSLIARANNSNNFSVKVRLIIKQLDNSVPYHCEEKTLDACSSAAFSIVDFTNFNHADFSINWEFRDIRDNHVCDQVTVFAAGRSDLPIVTEINSHLIPSSTLFHADFVIRSSDEACLPVCPS